MAQDVQPRKWIVYISNSKDARRNFEQDGNAGNNCAPPPNTFVRWGHKGPIGIQLGDDVWLLHGVKGPEGVNVGRPPRAPAFNVDLSFRAVIQGKVVSVKQDSTKFGGQYPYQYVISCAWSKQNVTWQFNEAEENPSFRDALRSSILAGAGGFLGLPRHFHGVEPSPFRQAGQGLPEVQPGANVLTDSDASSTDNNSDHGTQTDPEPGPADPTTHAEEDDDVAEVSVKSEAESVGGQEGHSFDNMDDDAETADGIGETYSELGSDVEIISWKPGKQQQHVNNDLQGRVLVDITAATINVRPNEAYSESDAKVRKSNLIEYATSLNLPKSRVWFIQEPFKEKDYLFLDKLVDGEDVSIVTGQRSRETKKTHQQPKKGYHEDSSIPPEIAFVGESWPRWSEQELSAMKEKKPENVVTQSEFQAFNSLCKALHCDPAAALTDIFTRCSFVFLELMDANKKAQALCIAISYHGRNNRSALGGQLPEKGRGFAIVAAFALTLAEKLKHRGCFIMLGADFNVAPAELQSILPSNSDQPVPSSSSENGSFRASFGQRMHIASAKVWAQGEQDGVKGGVAGPSNTRKRKRGEGGTQQDIDGILVFAPASSTDIENISLIGQDIKGTDVPGKVHPVVAGQFRVELKPLIKSSEL